MKEKSSVACLLMLQNTVLSLLWAGQYLQYETDVLFGSCEKSSEPGMAKALMELLPFSCQRRSPNSVALGSFVGATETTDPMKHHRLHVTAAAASSHLLCNTTPWSDRLTRQKIQEGALSEHSEKSDTSSLSSQ